MAALPRGNETILVVDDHSDFCRLMERMLHSLGYGVLTARDGLDALERFEAAERVDLVITDMSMPGMDGWQLVAALRLRRHDARVLFMSGHAREMLSYRGDPIEDVLFLRKPFTLESLARQVRRLLDDPAHTQRSVVATHSIEPTL
ncbi:MAG TPA: response regulator [Chloroflexi bacterium]|jgi:two-component system cell cycle sensor histidine kinase/response regulator CckA|nr:response regulator [Chloroflexota bacterium]